MIIPKTGSCSKRVSYDLSVLLDHFAKNTQVASLRAEKEHTLVRLE